MGQNHNPTRMMVIAAGLIMVILGALVTAGWLLLTHVPIVGMGSHTDDPQAICLENEQRLAMALSMYAADWDNRLPFAQNWSEVLYPYTPNNKILKCPADNSAAKCSYAMNAALSGRNISLVDNSAPVVLLYETNQPGASPRGIGNDIALRHNNGANYAFLGPNGDAFVKWRKTPPSFKVIFSKTTSVKPRSKTQTSSSK
jgi:prepilin-type processing-associated H-X9-DG protein